ncbi:LOW QUALITY PROTEIN: otoraplin [Cyanocitta cristata]
MTQSVYLMILLLYLRLMCPLATGIFMEKLISKKLCAADDCVYTISLARAEEDSDCSFINIKKGQLIYVSKLMNEKDSREFWAASIRVDSCVYEQTKSRLTHITVKKWMQMLSSLINQLKPDEGCFKVSNYTSPCLRVYGEQYEDHMGTVGDFPSSLVSEKHVYQEARPLLQGG